MQAHKGKCFVYGCRKPAVHSMTGVYGEYKFCDYHLDAMLPVTERYTKKLHALMWKYCRELRALPNEPDEIVVAE